MHPCFFVSALGRRRVQQLVGTFWCDIRHQTKVQLTMVEALSLRIVGLVIFFCSSIEFYCESTLLYTLFWPAFSLSHLPRGHPRCAQQRIVSSLSFFPPHSDDDDCLSRSVCLLCFLHTHLLSLALFVSLCCPVGSILVPRLLLDAAVRCPRSAACSPSSSRALSLPSSSALVPPTRGKNTFAEIKVASPTLPENSYRGQSSRSLTLSLSLFFSFAPALLGSLFGGWATSVLRSSAPSCANVFSSCVQTQLRPSNSACPYRCPPPSQSASDVFPLMLRSPPSTKLLRPYPPSPHHRPYLVVFVVVVVVTPPSLHPCRALLHPPCTAAKLLARLHASTPSLYWLTRSIHLGTPKYSRSLHQLLVPCLVVQAPLSTA